LVKSQVKSFESFFPCPILTVKIHEKLGFLVFDQLSEVSQPFAEFNPLWKEDCQKNYVLYNTNMYTTKYSKLEKGSVGINPNPKYPIQT